MIRRSRIFSFALALALALSVSGCGAKPAEQTSAASMQTETASPEQPSPSEMPQNSLRMLTNGTNQGRYRSANLVQDYTSLLCYLDFASGTEVPLCSSPNCKHLDSSCPAWFHSHNYIDLDALDSEHLVLLVSDLEANHTSLFLTDKDGSNRRILDEHPGAYTITPAFSADFLVDDTYLYYIVDAAMGASCDDKSVTEPVGIELFRVPFSGGAPEKLRDLPRDGTLLCGVFGRDLILRRYTLDDPQSMTGNGTTYFSLCSIDTGEETLLVSIPDSGFSTGVFFEQGRLYWIDLTHSNTLFWIDTDGNQGQLELDFGQDPNAFQEAWCEIKAFCQNYMMLNITVQDDSFTYAVDLTTGQTIPVSLSYVNMRGMEQPIDILQVVGSDLLVTFAETNEPSTHWNKDGSAFFSDVFIQRTGFISLEDYLASKNNYRECSMIPSF